MTILSAAALFMLGLCLFIGSFERRDSPRRESIRVWLRTVVAEWDRKDRK